MKISTKTIVSVFGFKILVFSLVSRNMEVEKYSSTFLTTKQQLLLILLLIVLLFSNLHREDAPLLRPCLEKHPTLLAQTPVTFSIHQLDVLLALLIIIITSMVSACGTLVSYHVKRNVMPQSFPLQRLFV